MSRRTTQHRSEHGGWAWGLAVVLFFVAIIIPLVCEAAPEKPSSKVELAHARAKGTRDGGLWQGVWEEAAGAIAVGYGDMARAEELKAKAESIILPKGWAIQRRPVRVATADGVRDRLITYYVNSIGMEFVRVSAGHYLRGSPDDELGRGKDEGPRKRIAIGGSFFLGAHEVTLGQYLAFLRAGGDGDDFDWKDRKAPLKKGEAGSYVLAKTPLGQTESQPVVALSWVGARKFCAWLRAKESVSYRLPTEAEWEYACRAGVQTPFYTGKTVSSALANFNAHIRYGDSPKGEFRGKTTPVGFFPANPWGFFDMHGNVWEWCSDIYGEYYYGSVHAADPKGPEKGDSRILRGGSWRGVPRNMRSAARYEEAASSTSMNFGFRIVVELPSK
jgi:formylglycine-generating enzyme required for sulfatase activity